MLASTCADGEEVCLTHVEECRWSTVCCVIGCCVELNLPRGARGSVVWCDGVCCCVMDCHRCVIGCVSVVPKHCGLS